MRALLWIASLAGFLALMACGSNDPTGFGPGQTLTGDDSGGGGGSSSGGSHASSSSGAIGTFTGDGGGGAVPGSGPCKGGKYEGTFDGSYASHLTLIGWPMTVTGNVDMTLAQEGVVGQKCTLNGEFQDCSNIYTMQNGTVTGVASASDMFEDGGGTGYPYFCTMTGTLDCAKKKLVNGWLQCTYCVGALADGGMACDFLNGVAGTTGVGGHFAGPVTADYDISAFALVHGTWNGAEALAGNDGGNPGPNGAPISSYLSDSGYIGFGYGGSGTWNATYSADH